MAVLYRLRNIASAFEVQLKHNSVPYTIVGNRDSSGRTERELILVCFSSSVFC